MKSRSIVQLAFFMIGAYCANTIAMDGSYESNFVHPGSCSENSGRERFSRLNTASTLSRPTYQQQMPAYSMDGFNVSNFVHTGSCSENSGREWASQVNTISGQQQMPTYQQQVPTFQQQVPTFQQQVPTFQQQVPTFQQQVPTYQQQVPTFQQQMPISQEQISAHLHMVSIQQQQMLFTQQQLMQQLMQHQQIISNFSNVMFPKSNVTLPATSNIIALTGSKKPAPLVPRKSIAATVEGKKLTFKRIVSGGAHDACGCRSMARSLPNKLIKPAAVPIDSADELLTHKYKRGDDHYFLYPKPSEALLYRDTTSVAEKIMKYKSAFSQVREENLKIADEQLVNPGPREKYLKLLKSIEQLDALDIEYSYGNPDKQDIAFLFKTTFYTLDKESLNTSLPLDKHGLCSYPKPNDSSLCIKHYEQRFDEVADHNLSVVKEKFAPEIVKDYRDWQDAIRETTLYSLQLGKQAKLIENKRAWVCF